jgi:hypothetical protein
MPTNTQEQFKDPDFLGLPEEEQIKVLGALDKEFSTFPKNIQLEIIKKGATVPVPSERKTLGTFVGGVVGAGVGALTRSGLTGTTIGAQVGGMVGKRVDQLREKESVMGQLPEAAVPTKEEFAEMGKAGLEEAAYELGGGILFKSAKRALAPFQGSIDPVAKELDGFLATRMKAKGFDMGLLPSEMASGGNWFLTLYQNIAEGALLGGGKIKKFKSARGEVLTDIADDIIEAYGRNASIEDVGEMFIGHITGKKSYHKAIGDALYNNLKKDAPGVFVPTRSIKAETDTVKKIADELNNFGAETAGYDLLGKVATFGDGLSLDAARAFKTNLMAAADVFKAQSSKSGGIALTKKLIGVVDEATEKALKASDLITGKRSVQTWRQANQFHKNWKSRFDNAVVRRMIHYADETGKGLDLIADDLFKSPTIVKRVKAALGEGSREFKLFQSFYVQDLFIRSVDEETTQHIIKRGSIAGSKSVISGKKMLKVMTGTKVRAETYNQLFNPTQKTQIEKFAQALLTTQKKESAGIGKMWIQLTQGGAIMGFATGLAPEAAGIVFLPALLAKMLTSKSGSELLTEGITVLKGDPRMAGLSARIIKEVIKIGNEEERRREAEKRDKPFVYTPEWS